MVAFQVHSYGYTSAWGNQRKSYYGVSGIPDVRIDGILEKHGSSGTDAANYANLKGLMDTRLAVPTDITMELGGEVVSGQKYRIVAKVMMDEDLGVAREVRLHFVDTLYDYPPSTPADGRYNYCVRQGTLTPYDVYLEPGESILVEHEFTFDSTSWSHQEDIAIFVLAHKKKTGKEISNAEMMSWPFPPPPGACPADINGDGIVDVLDLLAVLGTWGECAGCPEDITGDDLVDVLDLLQVLANWGPC